MKKLILIRKVLLGLLTMLGTFLSITTPNANAFTRFLLCNPFAYLYAAICIFIPVGIKVEVDKEAKIVYFKLKGIFPNCCFNNWNTSFPFEDISHFSIIKTRMGCCSKS